MTVANNAIDTQPANNGPWASPSNVPRTSPKDPIWPSQGRPKLTTWGHLEMTSRERPNLTSRIRPGGTDSGCPQDVLRMSPRRPWKHIWGKMWGHLWMSLKFFLLFFRNLFDWPNLCTDNSIFKVYLEPSQTDGEFQAWCFPHTSFTC